MKDEKVLTQARVQELLDYDEHTGDFRWRYDDRIRHRESGQLAGKENNKGYIRITIDGKTYFAHHLAWLWYYGGPVPKRIKHLNKIPYDNSINNLDASGFDW